VKYALALVAFLLLLCSCGVADWIDPKTPADITITTAKDLNGALGYCSRTGNAEFGAYVLDSVLTEDVLVGVVIHELLQPVRLIAKDVPTDPNWYCVSGDTQPIGAPVSPEEAAWITSVLDTYPDLRGFKVYVGDPALDVAVDEAIQRITDALGDNTFRRG
jgi:hypothetical protein